MNTDPRGALIGFIERPGMREYGRVRLAAPVKRADSAHRGRGHVYLRAPRCGFFKRDWRVFLLFRFGLLIRKVPLP
jgi:hypothetical protein